MIVGTQSYYDEAKSALERIQSFDVQTLERSSELGQKLNFKDVLDSAQNLIELYKRLSVAALQDFPDQTLDAIKNSANANYKLFTNILEFEPEQQDPVNVKNSHIQKVQAAYQPAFDALHQYISYSLHRSADFQRLDSEARATLQSIEDKAESLSGELKSHETAAKGVLDEIRKVAAEEGVTKQAAHFNAEYSYHEEQATKWQKYAVRLSIGLGVFAFLSLFLHKLPYLKPDSAYDAIQLSISKFLIFFVIAYMLFLSARNFLNHKHNAIVNKHRQNALMTHTALVEASGDEGVREAVLLQAASCIFSPQSTGYTKNNENDVSSQKSVVEILSKPIAQAVTPDKS